MKTLADLSARQLQLALGLKQRIEALEKELEQIISTEQVTAIPAARPAKKKKTMSAAARAKIAATQKARWAERKKAAPSRKSPAKKKGKLSPAGRARIIAGTKARWARFWAEKKG